MVKSETNNNVVVEAKTQYTKQLVSALRDVIYDTIIDDYDKVKNKSKKQDFIYDFQTVLLSYKKWNSDDIEKYTEKVVQRCEYLNEMITAVFITNIKILTSVKMNQKKQKMKITVPSNETFVHKLYVNVAKQIYNNVVNFHSMKLSNKKMEIYRYVTEAVDECVVNMLPIKEILDCYIVNTYDDDEVEEEETDDEEEVTEDIKPVVNEEEIIKIDDDPEDMEQQEQEQPMNEVSPEIIDDETKNIVINEHRKPFFDDIKDD